jgi:hypothetical protein
MSLDAETVDAFERLYYSSVEHGQAGSIDYQLSTPKWQFLCWLADEKPLVLHGSGDPDISEFEPRQSNDVNEFGNRQAIYGARDGLWPMYFAIVDRARYRMSLVNSCARVTEPAELAGSYYFFSVGASGDMTLPDAPWRSGTVYVLSDQTFEQQTVEERTGFTLESTQVASLVPVRPLAKLAIEPEDFPFLQQIRRHNREEVLRRAEVDPGGFPWLDE